MPKKARAKNRPTIVLRVDDVARRDELVDLREGDPLDDEVLLLDAVRGA